MTKINLNKSIPDKLCLTIIDFSYNLISGIFFSRKTKQVNTKNDVINILNNTATAVHNSSELYYKNNANKTYNLFIPDILKDLSIKTPQRKFRDIVYNPFHFTNLVKQNNSDEIIRFTAALANSLYYEIKSINNELNYLLDSYDFTEENKLFYKDFNRIKLLLVKCEITGYKNYIFGNVDYFSISAAMNSFSYLILLTKVIERYCLNFLKLTGAGILFNNNSSFCFLLPFSFKDKFEMCKVHINSILADAFNGHVHFSSDSEIITPCEIENLSFKWNKLSGQINNNYFNQFAEIGYKNIFNPFSNSDKYFQWFNKNHISLYNKEIRLKWYSNEPEVHNSYKNPFDVFHSFGYLITKSENHNEKTRNFNNCNSESFHLTSNGSDFGDRFKNLAVVEINFANPDFLFSETKRDLNLFTILKYYSTYNSKVIDLFSPYLYHSIHINNFNRIFYKLIYSTDTNYIFICELEQALKLSMSMINSLIPISKQTLNIPFLIDITMCDNEQLFKEKIQSFQKYFIGRELKNRYYNKIFLFNEEFTREEFIKLMEFLDLFIDLLREEEIEANRASLILKNLCKISFVFQKLSQNSEDGYLCFEEIWSLKNLLANLDIITENKKDRLIKVFEDTLISNLISKYKFNKMILAVASKITDLIVNKAILEKQPLKYLAE